MTINVTFRPGAYLGQFRIWDLDARRFVAGPFSAKVEAVDLSPGRYTVHVDHGVDFPFQVLAEGRVENGRSAGLTCAGTDVSFNTHRVQFVTGSFAGRWWIPGAEIRPGAADQRKLDLIIDVVARERDAGYSINLAPGCGFRFNLDANGDTSVNEHHRASAECNGSIIRFQSSRVTVSPNDETQKWAVTGVEGGFASGARTLFLVKGIQHSPAGDGYIINLPDTRSVRFGTDADGTPYPDTVTIPSTTGDLVFRLTRG